jgi:preprotein translocase SecF subunit
MFGVSPEATIYSFGFTLVTGVALNFFFGVLMTMLMNAAVSKFKIFQNRKLYGETDKKEKKQFEFVGNTKKFSIFAAACILLTVAGAFFGVEMAIEFKGGTVLTYSYEGDADFSGVNADIEAIVGSAVNVRQGENLQSGTNAVPLEFGSLEGLSLDRQTEITDKLVEKYPDSNIEVLDTNDVSAKTGRSFLLKCLVAVVASIVFLVIYMAFRFKKIGGFSAGMFAIIALVHDCVFVFAAFLIFRYPINANFVAAALTILGYSINNTIVIYDRIRENSALMPKADFIENVNLSINQSLKRSVRTTVTTAITMLTVSIIALLSNVETILSFSIPLLFGLIAGTFSSLCLAPTLWAVSRSKKRTDK